MTYTCFLCKKPYEERQYLGGCPDCKIQIFDHWNPSFFTNGSTTSILKLQFQENFYKIEFYNFKTIVHQAIYNEDIFGIWQKILHLDYPISLTTNISFILALS